LVADEAII